PDAHTLERDRDDPEDDRDDAPGARGPLRLRARGPALALADPPVGLLADLRRRGRRRRRRGGGGLRPDDLLAAAARALCHVDPFLRGSWAQHIDAWEGRRPPWRRPSRWGRMGSMALIDELMASEHRLALGSGPEYEATLAEEALVIVPGMVLDARA